MELQHKRRNIITSIDSKIKDVKKQLEDLIKQREKLRLMSLCHIPENKYIHDLTAHLQLEHEEADFEKGEYSDYVDGNLIISYNFINEDEDEKVKVILEVNLSSDKTYDCREIPHKYFDINLKVTSNTTEKIINLEKKIETQSKEIEKNIIDQNELDFLRLNLIYSSKCQKSGFKKGFKVGTPEYRECILRKGRKISD